MYLNKYWKQKINRKLIEYNLGKHVCKKTFMRSLLKEFVNVYIYML